MIRERMCMRKRKRERKSTTSANDAHLLFLEEEL